MLKLRRPWDSQPQENVGIDGGKPSSASIHAYAVASIGRQLNDSPLTAYNGAIIVPSPAGLAWDLSASSAYVDLGAVPTTAEGVSFVCIGKQDTANTFMWSTRTGSTSGFELLLGAGGAGTAQVRRGGNISTPQATGLNDGRFHAYAGSWDANVVSLTVDGVHIGVATGLVTQAHTQNLFIGRRGSTYANGAVAMMALFLRPMSIEEQIELTRTLESVYNRTLQDRTIWVPVSAGGATTHATTGALAGAGGAIDGTAAHIAIHGTTGAIAGAGGAVDGAAARTRAHPTTGVLAGSGGAVVGAAVYNALHTTTGVLAGAGGVVDGAADHVVPGGTHATTGALAGGGGAVVGTAAHIAVHGTTGVLAGAGGAVVGAAARVAAAVTHATSGALVGGGGVVDGAASGPVIAQALGGGGYLPSFRRKTRREIHAERVRLGILPEQIKKAAQKVVEKAAERGDPEEVYEDNTAKYQEMFLREIGATKWAPDYARAIAIQLEIMERDAEDALLLM